MTRIYLDHNATTRLHPDARDAMLPLLDDCYGNPSSIHAQGRAARDVVERARAEVASLLGAAGEEIVFTSGGTEANALAVVGGAQAARAAEPRRTRVLASPIEHPSVDAPLEALARDGFEVTRLRVDSRGRLDLQEVARALGDQVALVAVQLANHELGNILPVVEIAALAHAAGARLHIDAVQAAGKLPVDVKALDADSASISAHKIHGPKGIAALYLRNGREPAPPALGGHQERGRRPGTENVPGIAAFGVAARLARSNGPAWSARIASLRDQLEAGALALGATVNGDANHRVCNTTNLSWNELPGELLVANLDLAGVSASTGAACTSGSVAPSPVLLALGRTRTAARSGVRFSLGPDNTAAEIEAVLDLLPAIIERIRRA